MSAEIISSDRFCPKNVQPGKESPLPVCPNYPLIQICGRFAGMDEEDLASRDDFCGTTVRYENTLGLLSGHKGYVYTPRMVCTKIRDELVRRLHLVSEQLDEPNEDFLEQIQEIEDLGEREKKFEEEAEKLGKYNHREEILDSWRTAVYEITCVPPESKNPNEAHFRTRTIDELTDEEVIETVKTFLASLENNVTGKGSDLKAGIISLSLSAIHCPQTPQWEETGEIS